MGAGGEGGIARKKEAKVKTLKIRRAKQVKNKSTATIVYGINKERRRAMRGDVLKSNFPPFPIQIPPRLHLAVLVLCAKKKKC